MHLDPCGWAVGDASLTLSFAFDGWLVEWLVLSISIWPDDNESTVELLDAAVVGVAPFRVEIDCGWAVVGVIPLLFTFKFIVGWVVGKIISHKARVGVVIAVTLDGGLVIIPFTLDEFGVTAG